MLLDIVFIVAGLALLVAGGEALVRGASTLAVRGGVPPLIVGLVIVSAATSTPEFAVTFAAVLDGQPDLALGNVVGSNIVNILFILGLSALISPLIIKSQLVRFDIPVMVGLSAVVLAVSLDGRIGFVDGLVLFAVLVAHTVISVVVGRREVAAQVAPPSASSPESPAKPMPLWLALLSLVVGIGLLVAGARLLVDGAVSIATGLGVSSLIIGLTVVAVGTSLPELATSLIAVRRGERDMAVGNIVGSNIFNIGMVLGVPAMIAPNGVPVSPAAIAFDIPVMVAVALALLPVAFTGFVLARWEGGVFVALYVAYTLYLVLASTEHDALSGFTAAMLWFVLPVLALSFVVATSYEVGVIRGRRLGASREG